MTGDDLALPGFLATMLGLACTWWQAWKARDAADAARSAAEAATRQFSGQLLQSAIPELRTAEAELRSARERDDHDAALAAVKEWRTAAVKVRALMTRRGELGNDTATVFSRCAALADDAERDLAGRQATVDDSADDLLRGMGDLSVS